MSMTYEQRKRAIFDFLYREPGGLLHRYRLPEHLSDDAIRDEVNMLVDDVNGLIPSETTETELRLLLPDINTAIRRRHGAQGWPPAKIFIAATEDALSAAAKRRVETEPALTALRDTYQLTAAAMKAGQPVAEHFLWGRQAVEMIARGLVDQETMVRYRSAIYAALRDQYGEQRAQAWEDEAKARHQSAKAAYLDRRDGREIDPATIDRLQSELASVGAGLDRRADDMRRFA